MKDFFEKFGIDPVSDRSYVVRLYLYVSDSDQIGYVNACGTVSYLCGLLDAYVATGRYSRIAAEILHEFDPLYIGVVSSVYEFKKEDVV